MMPALFGHQPFAAAAPGDPFAIRRLNGISEHGRRVRARQGVFIPFQSP